MPEIADAEQREDRIDSTRRGIGENLLAIIGAHSYHDGVRNEADGFKLGGEHV